MAYRFKQQHRATSEASPSASPISDWAVPTYNSSREISPSLSVQNLELLHHYMISTSNLFGSSLDSLEFWQTKVPKLSFQYQFLLQLLLSLTAYHQATTDFNEHDKLMSYAGELFAHGVRAETELIPQLNKDNCLAIYLGAVLICFCTFGAGPKPGDYLIFSDFNGPATLASVIRGVRTIVNSSREEEKDAWQSTTRLTRRHDEATKDVTYQNRVYDYHAAFRKLRGYFVQMAIPLSDEETAIYAQEINSLEQSFTIILRDTMPNEDTALKYAHVMFAWIYHNTEEYTLLVQEKQPPALIIFAYFAALMKYHDSLWILKGWPEHVIAGVYAYVTEMDREWLTWPMEQIGWSPV